MKIYYDTTSGVAQRIFPLEQVRMLCSHEGVMAVDNNGDPRYKDVRLSKGEEPFVVSAIEEGLRHVEQMLGTLLTREAVYTGSYAEFDFRKSCLLREDSSLAGSLAECAVEYAMYRWLEIRLPGRSEHYLQRFADKAKSTVILAAEKPLPELRSDDSSVNP